MSCDDTRVYIPYLRRSRAHHPDSDLASPDMSLHPGFSSRYTPAKAQTYVILWLLISLSSALVLKDSGIVEGLQSLNTTQLQDSFNSSNSANCHCTNRKDWIGDGQGYEIVDCFNARRMFWEDMLKNKVPDQLVEYVGHAVVPTTRLKKVETPARWTSGE